MADGPAPGSQEWIDKHMAVAHELAVKSANSVPPAPPSYPTEWVECDRCDGYGEYEDDLWVTVRCYSCWGTGHIEVCAECGDTGEECDACGC